MHLTQTQAYQHLLHSTCINPASPNISTEADFYVLGKATVLAQDNPDLEDLKTHFTTTYPHWQRLFHTRKLQDHLGRHPNEKPPFPPHLQPSLTILGLKEEDLGSLKHKNTPHDQTLSNQDHWLNFLAQLIHELGHRVPGVPLADDETGGYMCAPKEDLYHHLTSPTEVNLTR